MENSIEIVFFDLFFTLVIPQYNDLRNEYDILGVTKEEWESYAEDEELYFKRASGCERDPEKIIEAVIEKMKVRISEFDKREILELRKERFKKSLLGVDDSILKVLLDLKGRGKKLCLISNADIIDVMYWNESPLSRLFDDWIFSYEAGFLKPKIEIYKIALKRMNTTPDKCAFIGDGGSDELKGARESGMTTILAGHILKRDGVENSSIREFADYSISDFKEISSIIL